MQATLLCVGDMHLGRRPSRIPDGLEHEYRISIHELDPRAAWRAVVREALQREVDAVLLAGDVVESKNGFLEAYGALLAGVQELGARGIEVVAVAGNHDVEVLPRLADELPAFHLLGRGGKWSTHVVSRDGTPRVRILGWSFSGRRVESSPLDSLSPEMRRGRYGDGADDDLRTVGLLHCDLDAAGSCYAPVASSALARLTPSAWFLGHQHAPTIHSGGRPLGYLGSLVGMDPGERGAHGPWLARSVPGSWQLEQIALSPVRWEEVPVPIDEEDDLLAVQAAIARALPELDARIRTGFEGTRLVGCRPRLIGRTSLGGRELRGALDRARNLSESIEGVVYFIDQGFDETEAALDLEALARGSDPAAIVARRLLELREGGGEARKFLRQAAERLAEVGGHRNFFGLGALELEDEEVLTILVRTLYRALTELLAQKAPGSPERVAEPVSEVGA